MTEKPHSPSCERNKEPILAVLRDAFAARTRVLEIGSGTGQHAVHFAAAMPWLTWQTSDRVEHHAGMRLWIDEAGLANVRPPLVLDVNQAHWPSGPFDAVFSANTLHIMAWEEVQRLFRRLPELLAPAATVAIYGPFNYGGQFTSPSNADFDARLRGDDPRRGIRAFEGVDALAQAIGLRLLRDHAMPANNRCLVWERVTRDPA